MKMSFLLLARWF